VLAPQAGTVVKIFPASSLHPVRIQVKIPVLKNRYFYSNSVASGSLTLYHRNPGILPKGKKRRARSQVQAAKMTFRSLRPPGEQPGGFFIPGGKTGAVFPFVGMNDSWAVII
jgi:hypothetical protein